MIPQKLKQLLLITLTVATVLTLAYLFRSPRQQQDETSAPTLITVTKEATTELNISDEPTSGNRQEDIDEPTPSSDLLTTLEELRMKFLESPYSIDKFTIVTPTYKRTENLFKLFKTYCPNGDIIDKILILWNNIGVPVPEEISKSAAECSVPVVIKIMEKNNLTSRFIVYPEIQTTAILSIDDDLLLPNDSLHLAFNTWKRYPYLLVGYTQRTYREVNGKYKYVIQGADSYTMIMTNVAFIHRFYLDLFSSTVPKKVIDYIIQTTNGEDLTMNVIIGKYLTDMGHPQPVGIRMQSKKFEIGNLSKSGYKGLWHRSGHQNQRTQCLNLLGEVYGGLYLQKSTLSISRKDELSTLGH